MCWEDVSDPVLKCLLKMGIYNWKNEDTRLHQATQAIRHGTAISTRILGRVLQQEHKVALLKLFRAREKLTIALSEIAWRLAITF